jgi:hypothetical protein
MDSEANALMFQSASGKKIAPHGEKGAILIAPGNTRWSRGCPAR